MSRGNNKGNKFSVHKPDQPQGGRFAAMNARLFERGLRRNPKVNTPSLRESRGIDLQTERIVSRRVKNKDGTEELRSAIAPASRSKYTPQPGEPIGRPKPNRNHGQPASVQERRKEKKH